MRRAGGQVLPEQKAGRRREMHATAVIAAPSLSDLRKAYSKSVQPPGVGECYPDFALLPPSSSPSTLISSTTISLSPLLSLAHSPLCLPLRAHPTVTHTLSSHNIPRSEGQPPLARLKGRGVRTCLVPKATSPAGRKSTKLTSPFRPLFIILKALVLFATLCPLSVHSLHL